MRIAFVTPEFISEKSSGGGLGNYLNRITQALKEFGHEPEVFVTSSAQPSVIDFNGVRVERVPPTQKFPVRLISKSLRKLKIAQDAPWGGPSAYLSVAQSLADAFEKRHKENPFNFVQSSNCHASGLLLPRVPNCPHLIRLSSKRDLWFDIDRRGYSLGTQWLWQLERACVRKADIAYAPSQYVAQRCQDDNWREEVHVVRPPIFVETQANPNPPPNLPERFFIHFGQIGDRKGSFDLARALCQVWQEIPEFRMVWAGNPIREGDYESCHKMWGENAHKVQWLGALEKSKLYAALQRAEAAVLPSKVDNLPNTVIESLNSAIPVIGFDGGSVNELVDSQTGGRLVPMGDVEALAEMIIQAWRGNLPKLKPHHSNLPESIHQAFQPEQAVKNLINLAGY